MIPIIAGIIAVVLVPLLLRARRNRSQPSAPRLDAPPMIDHPSPNFNDRKVSGQPTVLILHYTAMDTTEAALERLSDPKSEVSSHYLVGEDGTIYRLVAEDKRAWHAGVSYWEGNTDINSMSIGIEIANQGDRPFADAQMASVTRLCLWILSRYDISQHHVIGHMDIAPGRKPDPGWFFPWQNLAGQGIGVWPEPTPQDYQSSANWGNTQIRKALSQYGYNPQTALNAVVESFQRHFQQEVANSPERIGVADKDTAARLSWLLRWIAS
jgi:N-acetylmuramoyl-L-alanine amidase